MTTGALTGTVLTGCARQAPLDASGDAPMTNSHATPMAGRPRSASPYESAPSLVAPSAPPPPLPVVKGPILIGTAITEIAVPGPYMASTIDDGPILTWLRRTRRWLRRRATD